MATISTSDIQTLREQTGVGMMDAKRALEATSGDMVAAVEHLRKSGQKVAAAKSARQVKAGSVGLWVSDDGRRGAAIALACETDFVARTDNFRQLASQLAAHLGSLPATVASTADFLTQPGLDGDTTVQQSIERAITTLGENIQVPQVTRLLPSAGTIESYLHANMTVAALVAVDPTNEAVGHDLALHVAAMNPRFRDATEIPAELVEKERAIYREQLQREGKPEAMWEKILPGKLKKFYGEVCLFEQPFVKDDSLTVAQFLQPSGTTVTGFARLAI